MMHFSTPKNLRSSFRPLILQNWGGGGRACGSAEVLLLICDHIIDLSQMAKGWRTKVTAADKAAYATPL